MREALTLQINLDDTWRDAAEVVVDTDDRRTRVHLTYAVDHIFPLEDTIDRLPAHYRAVSLRWPLDLAPRSLDHWPALFDDIGPGGAAKRWWQNRLGRRELTPADLDLVLLRDAAIAPIGNLRIKTAIERALEVADGSDTEHTFPIESVLERDFDFLDHAAMSGASIGGGTGAGGEAPKLLLRQRDQTIWLDTAQDDALADAHMLVKFARRTRPTYDGRLVSSERDQHILMSEAVYYRALTELGVNTVDVDRMTLRINSQGQHSLWMPRFDVLTRSDGRRLRAGVESLYSLTDSPPGAHRDHQTFIDTLYRCTIASGLIDIELIASDVPPEGGGGESLVVEYIWRDLLNEVFGNSDNHGRNIAVLKTPTGVSLAPVYDFAPMKMDPTGVTRSTRWRRDIEGREIDWLASCRAQAHLADPDAVWTALRGRARALVDLDARLQALGLPEETLTFPAIGLPNTNAKLKRWDLV